MENTPRLTYHTIDKLLSALQDISEELMSSDPQSKTQKTTTFLLAKMLIESCSNIVEASFYAKTEEEKSLIREELHKALDEVVVFTSDAIVPTFNAPKIGSSKIVKFQGKNSKD